MKDRVVVNFAIVLTVALALLVWNSIHNLERTGHTCSLSRTFTQAFLKQARSGETVELTVASLQGGH